MSVLRHPVGVAVVLSVLLAGAPLFVALGEADAENDEAGYSFAVEEMLENGDWLTPRAIPTHDQPFLEKPPLKFWIVAAPIRLGLLPLNDFGLRFWDALFGAAAMAYVCLLGCRLGGPLAGVSAAVFLFVYRPLIVEHGLRTNNMEAPVLLAYCGGMYHFLAWRDRSAAGGRGHAIAAALYFVLGFMTKFVAAVFLPFVWSLQALRTARDRARIRDGWRAWMLAILLALGLILPWFLYQSVRAGSELWDTLVMGHVVRRFTSGLDPGHLQPWHYYFSEMWRSLSEAGTLGITVAGAAWMLVQTLRGRLRDGGAILTWCLAPIALLSFGTSKLHHYAYPFLPPVALAAGVGVAALAGVARRALAWVFGGDAAAGRVPDLAHGTIVALVVLSVLPGPAYAAQWGRLVAGEHPIRAVRDCLRRVIDQPGAPAPPGFWVEGRLPDWIYFYNFRGLGPWQERDVPSDATVVLNLVAPESWRPVLIAESRFQDVRTRLLAGDAALIDQLARRMGTTADAVQARLNDADIGMVTVLHGRILLPGPYRGCAPDQFRAGREP